MPIYLFIFAVYLAVCAIAVADCLKSNNQNKLGWIAMIVMLPFFGPVLYLGLATGRYVSEL